jgi:hypothetical protein
METIYTPGVAHLSYVLGDGGQAAVVAPRRDTDIYLEIAYRQGANITHIFETHRNENYVTGALDLAGRTGAAIHHGSQLDFRYGHPVNEGDDFQLGDAKLSILQLPHPKPLVPDDFARAMDNGIQVVDVRNPEAYAGAHIWGSYSLPLAMVPAFAGMFLELQQRPAGDDCRVAAETARHAGAWGAKWSTRSPARQNEQGTRHSIDIDKE